MGQQVLKGGARVAWGSRDFGQRSLTRTADAGLQSISAPAEQAKPVASFYAISALKRIFDVAFAGAALLALSLVMIAIAIAIATTSRGPILFRQQRTGYRGAKFNILKFRSMVAAEDGDEVRQAVRHDRRVTAVGQFLRRTSLDELPQFFNVLVGDMSIVGPRPHAVAHDSLFQRQAPDYGNRFAARPGITGLAQVCGSRGLTPDSDSVRLRTRLDLEYVASASFLLDFKILCLTVKEVVRSDTAF